jgi:hypothetical protein
VLKICKKEAISEILDMLAIKTVVNLSCLRLLFIIVKLTLSASLVAYKNKLWEGDKVTTLANNLSGANAHDA